MKKAGISIIVCFSLLLISSIISISYQPRSERKARNLMRTLMVINFSAYAFGIRGGISLMNSNQNRE